MREIVTFSQKSNDCDPCMWRGRVGSSHAGFGVAFFQYVHMCIFMYKVTSCEIFRGKKENPKVFHLFYWSGTASQLRTGDTWSQMLWCWVKVTLLRAWDWFMVASYWLESRIFSEGEDEIPKPFLFWLSSLTLDEEQIFLAPWFFHSSLHSSHIVFYSFMICALSWDLEFKSLRLQWGQIIWLDTLMSAVNARLSGKK